MEPEAKHDFARCSKILLQSDEKKALIKKHLSFEQASVGQRKLAIQEKHQVNIELA